MTPRRNFAATRPRLNFDDATGCRSIRAATGAAVAHDHDVRAPARCYAKRTGLVRVAAGEPGGRKTHPGHRRPIESCGRPPLWTTTSPNRPVQCACSALPRYPRGTPFGGGLRAISRVHHGRLDETPAAPRPLQRMLVVVRVPRQRSGCGRESARSSWRDGKVTPVGFAPEPSTRQPFFFTSACASPLLVGEFERDRIPDLRVGVGSLEHRWPP